MASDIAPSPRMTNGDAADSYQSSLNSNHLNNSAEPGQVADSQLPPPVSKIQSETPAAPIKESTSATTELPAPSGSLENSTSTGIQPVADFLPKEASNLSHPTPPPDEPLTTTAPDVDVEMNDDSTIAPPAPDAPESSLRETITAAPPAPAAVAGATAPVSEPSLVRPREDDEIEQPAAKRSRLDDEVTGSLPLPSDSAAPVVPDAPPAPAPTPAVEAPSSSGVANVVDAPIVEKPLSDEVAVDAPVLDAIVKDAPVADVPAIEAPVQISDAAVSNPPVPDVPISDAPAVAASVTDSAVTSVINPPPVSTAEPTIDAPAEPVVDSIPEPTPAIGQEAKVEAPSDEIKVETTSLPAATSIPAATSSTESTVKFTDTAEAAPKPSVEDQPATTPVMTEAQTTAGAQQPPADQASTQPQTAQPSKYDTRDLTPVQKSFLTEKMKNLKKTKSSTAFLRPVDPVALNIPNYYDIIKTPMDLTTMEGKIKENKYQSIQDFVNDFDLIINNVRRFNGDAHPITIAGMNMDAYFRRMMETAPSADVPVAPPKPAKKRSPSIPRENRRQSRVVTAPVAAEPTTQTAGSPTAPATTYALNNDGTPQLRRDSNRPQRAIKPPQNREITYAKPKRKEHQLELRFCEHVLDEVRSAKYGALNHVFLTPVDPVALNIPHYRQIIKNPMDLATMSNKLKGGQYTTANEFKKDFNLMVQNCLTFNPHGNPVHDIGIKFQREFDALWAEKGKWEKVNQPAVSSNRASSASAADDDSGDEDDEEDEDDEDGAVDEKEATIRALQKQLAAMQNALSNLGDSKPAKPKKAKSGGKAGGGGSKKAHATTVPVSKPKTKSGAAAKPKKPKQVSYEEKQEISDAVGRMSEAQVGRLTAIITSNCAKYRDMDEMELEIDDLPNDVQAKLLEYVRSIFGRARKKQAAREPSPDDVAAVDDDDFEPEHRASGGAGGGGGRGGRAGGGGKRKKHKPMGKKEQSDTIRSLQDKLAQFSNVGTSGSESPTNNPAGGFRNAAPGAAGAADESSGDEDSEESEEE